MHCSTMPNLRNWLALYHSPGVGSVTFNHYLAADPALNKLPRNVQPDWRGVDLDLAWLQKHRNANILTLQDERYPVKLKHINNAPPILYVRGDAECLNFLQIAMVGSRNPSSVGVQQAIKFATDLANLGLVVTSGLAQGIDAASHKGALAAVDGKTIAVLGHGMDRIYPERNKQLAIEIMAHGCLVSEFPIGTPPHAFNFPRRNRIISGMSEAVLIVEAALDSGSLITADCALDQGRDVMAIPGAIHNPKVKGCLHLIRQGAKLVETLQDVLEEVNSLKGFVIHDRNASAVANLQKINLAAPLERILRMVDYEATCLDVIVGRSGLAAGIVGAILLELELQGLIAAVPGGYARKLG